VQRAVAAVVADKAPVADHGADADGPYSRPPSYDQLNALAAMSRFAYVYASTTRRAADLASLPLKLYAGHPARDPDAEVVGDHPLLDLLDEPNSDQTGEEWRRQQAVDLFLPGNAYALKVGPSPKSPPLSLLRLHPEDVRIVPQRHGAAVRAFEVNLGDDGRWYDPELVMHVRGPSWERGPQGLYGQGVIRALHDELTTKMRAREHQRRMAGQGRPDVVLSPKDSDDAWGETARKDVLEAWAKMADSGNPLVLGGAVSAEFLNLSPRDMEFTELDKRIRDSIMAATQTPPVILGLETANYATANKQDGVYWRGLMHEAALFDARWTVGLARLYPDHKGKKLYIRHDFSGVLALQSERTAQVDRAHKHMEAGATPAEAYAYEGLAGAPVSDEVIEVSQPAPAAVADEPTEDTSEDVEQVTDPEEADDKAFTRALGKSPARRSAWEAWLVKQHKPAEKRLRRAAAGYLRRASGRYRARLAQAQVESNPQLALVSGLPTIVPRGLDLGGVIDEVAERAAMLAEVGPAWRRSWQLAASAAASQLPLSDFDFDPNDPEVVRALDTLIKGATKTQAGAVRTIVEDGLADGASIGQMQEAIERASAFGPARARRIARTEATRSVNMGTLSAYREAAGLGLAVQKVWMTAADGGERHPSYVGLDGQVRALDADFDLDGTPAAFPGGSGVAEEDINCRCTTSAQVTGGEPLF